MIELPVLDPVVNVMRLEMTTSTVSIGRVNWLGVWTLYLKEIGRIMLQTVIAPSVSALLFLTVFSLALGGALRTVGDIPYLQFLAPGLIMMALFQNSFQNSMASLIVAKSPSGDFM